jgi:hypothetical protein
LGQENIDLGDSGEAGIRKVGEVEVFERGPAPEGSGFRVRVQGLGFRVQGQGSGFRVQDSGFRVRVQGSGSGFRVQGSGSRV